MQSSESSDPFGDFSSQPPWDDYLFQGWFSDASQDVIIGAWISPDASITPGEVAQIVNNLDRASEILERIQDAGLVNVSSDELRHPSYTAVEAVTYGQALTDQGLNWFIFQDPDDELWYVVIDY